MCWLFLFLYASSAFSFFLSWLLFIFLCLFFFLIYFNLFIFSFVRFVYLIVLVFYLFMSFSFFYTLCFSVFFIHSFSLSLFASSFSTSSFHSSINCLLSFCYLLLSTSFLSSNLLYFKHFSHSVIPILSLYVRLLIFSFYARASIMSTLENLIFRKFLSRNTFS